MRHVLIHMLAKPSRNACNVSAAAWTWFIPRQIAFAPVSPSLFRSMKSAEARSVVASLTVGRRGDLLFDYQIGTAYLVGVEEQSGVQIRVPEFNSCR